MRGVTVTLLLMIGVRTEMSESTMSQYFTFRNKIIAKEQFLAVGGDISLTHAEQLVNEQLLIAKQRELAPVDSPSYANFVHVIDRIRSSAVFKLIKRLPKGASLHNHLFASASVDYVINELIAMEKNLYVTKSDVDGRSKYKFLPMKGESTWELLTEKRNNLNDEEFKRLLRSELTINSEDRSKSILEVWQKFKQIFSLTYDLFTCINVFEKYVYQVLKENYDDNVLYLEIKAPFVYLYDLNGIIYDEDYFIKCLLTISSNFKKDHHRFIGMKYIYAPYRKIDSDTLKNNLEILRKLIDKYPNFIIGIDFVGFEGDAPLKDHVDTLRQIHNLNLYVHAGETNNYGDAIDENVLDAILLGSKRIGHAFSLSKHPELIKIVKEKNIAIEVCPISNQVLKLVNDLRNHPAAVFIASGLPIVVCSDDPGNWGAEGLSYDWYMTFMTMTHRKSGLEFLKILARNSITYSGLLDEEKDNAFRQWEEDWKHFINESLELIKSIE